MTPGSGAQLVLPFPVNERCVFGNFQTGVNRELVERLQAMKSEQGFVGLWVWGAAGAGVSHLLQASCQHYAEHGRRVAYLPLARLGRDPEILDGMDDCEMVALDDVQTWAGAPALEATIVGFFQSLLSRGRHLLVGSVAAARGAGFELADLGSRLAGLASYRVGSLDDDGKAQLLRRLAGERGLVLSDAVLSFWLAHSDRAVDRLLRQLDELDAASMSAKRAVSIPLLKDVFGL